MACPSCTAEWLSAARQEGPVDDLDEQIIGIGGGTTRGFGSLKRKDTDNG